MTDSERMERKGIEKILRFFLKGKQRKETRLGGCRSRESLELIAFLLFEKALNVGSCVGLWLLLVVEAGISGAISHWSNEVIEKAGGMRSGGTREEVTFARV